jgi:hypothetical protein
MPSNACKAVNYRSSGVLGNSSSREQDPDVWGVQEAGLIQEDTNASAIKVHVQLDEGAAV